MTCKVTFEGRPVVPLPSGDVLCGVVDDRDHLRIRRESEVGTIAWDVDLGLLGEDPSLRYADSWTSDYGCLYWTVTDTLVLLGDTTALVIGAADGSVRASYELEPVGKSSLEVCGVSLVPEADAVLIVSAKRVWLIGSDLKVLLRVDTDALLASFPMVEQGSLFLDEYDFESVEGEPCTRSIPINSPSWTPPPES
ncbi:hypothetical protein ACFS5L_42120 [Streptomyces phyllanthi]|uniref:Uncharacterized protein n=1 Tax=Streptomyces phyllanthi TaxID=1803180 RepID=A0A5N8WD64_9ACTN|nr:hypothetical protein [Streptomyces phyllanthi]MPY45411.1 hypothetical protein [Streptomyces phyllanthi]